MDSNQQSVQSQPVVPQVPPTPVTPIVETPTSPGEPKKALIIGLVVLVIIAVVGGIFLYMNNQTSYTPEAQQTPSQIQGTLDSLNKELESSDTTGTIDQDFKSVDSDLQSL